MQLGLLLKILNQCSAGNNCNHNRNISLYVLDLCQHQKVAIHLQASYCISILPNHSLTLFLAE